MGKSRKLRSSLPQHGGARLKLTKIPLNHTIINTLEDKVEIMHMCICVKGNLTATNLLGERAKSAGEI